MSLTSSSIPLVNDGSLCRNSPGRRDVTSLEPFLKWHRQRKNIVWEQSSTRNSNMVLTATDNLIRKRKKSFELGKFRIIQADQWWENCMQVISTGLWNNREYRLSIFGSSGSFFYFLCNLQFLELCMSFCFVETRQCFFAVSTFKPDFHRIPFSNCVHRVLEFSMSSENQLLEVCSVSNRW